MFMGCPPQKPPTTVDEGPRRAFLAAVGACAAEQVTAFQTTATALAASPTRENWKSAMVAWQRVEMMQFGPTGSSTNPGGQDFRDQLYSWPLVSRCAIDDALVAKSYENGVGGLLVNRRGLAALEYLLFYAGDDASCSTAGWNALTADEHAARKQAYAAAVAADIKTRADALVTAWNGGFVETLRTAGSGNATYPSLGGAMNQVSDALFALEDPVKEEKVGEPLGHTVCTAPPCLELLESQYANHNTANIRANLVGFRMLLQGCGPDFSGGGLDDLLVASGASSLSERLIAGLNGAEAALAAIEEPDLRDALVADRPSVLAFYQALKVVTDLLKSELMMVLDLRLPAALEGDND